jgi:hypothetical protein
MGWQGGGDEATQMAPSLLQPWHQEQIVHAAYAHSIQTSNSCSQRQLKRGPVPARPAGNTAEQVLNARRPFPRPCVRHRYFQARATLPTSYWMGYSRRYAEDGWATVTDGSYITDVPNDSPGNYSHWGILEWAAALGSRTPLPCSAPRSAHPHPHPPGSTSTPVCPQLHPSCPALPASPRQLFRPARAPGQRPARRPPAASCRGRQPAAGAPARGQPLRGGSLRAQPPPACCRYAGDVPGLACARASNDFVYDRFLGDSYGIEPSSNSLQLRSLYQTAGSDTKFGWSGVACGTLMAYICEVPAELFSCPPPAPRPPPPPQPPSPPLPPAAPTCAPPNNNTLVCDGVSQYCWSYNARAASYADAAAVCAEEGGVLATYR